MILDYDVIEYYEYFYKKRFNSVNYRFNKSEKSVKIILNFLSMLNKKFNIKTIGREFLFDYFIYQFNYWRNANLTAVYGKFRIELIIGRKAFLRYSDNEKDDLWTIQASEIYKLYNINKEDLINAKNNLYNADYEISIKKQKHNTDVGFYQCIISTTLYNHNHISCITCNYKNDCKKLLKKNFPKLYEDRQYND